MSEVLIHEFRINDYLQLKLIDRTTYIYVNGEIFNHCNERTLIIDE